MVRPEERSPEFDVRAEDSLGPRATHGPASLDL